MSGVATSHVLDKLRPNEDGKERCAFARSYGVFTHRSMGGMEIQNQNLEKCVKVSHHWFSPCRAMYYVCIYVRCTATRV